MRTEPCSPLIAASYRELARQRLQRYSWQHAEHASLNTPHGLLPFARVPVIEGQSQTQRQSQREQQQSQAQQRKPAARAAARAATAVTRGLWT
jgi:hypothetical protein